MMAFRWLPMPCSCSALLSASASAFLTTRIFSASPLAFAATCSRWAALISFMADFTFASGTMSVTSTLTISYPNPAMSASSSLLHRGGNAGLTGEHFIQRHSRHVPEDYLLHIRFDLCARIGQLIV